jgi:ubiquinone/menaquinone biosynthesis C-methylase UbiE/uncharacterized protein YbaR (Trm112 family)
MLEGLLCPNCRSKLDSKQNSYFCAKCSIEFEIKDGIHLLLPSHIHEAVLWDIKAWDDKDSGRAEHLPPMEAILGLESRIRDFLDHMEWSEYKDGKALEIGGGSCWASIILKSKCPRVEVYATDVAASALSRAKELSKVFNVNIDKYIAIDIQSNPFPNDYFDLVFGAAVLHHVPDLMKATKETYRVLKPGSAYLGFEEMMMSPFFKLLFTRKDALRAKKGAQYPTPERVYSLGQWVTSFKNAGFREVKITICKNPRYKYFTRRLLWYYLLVEKIPDFIISRLLGSEIHIKATK